VQRVDRRDLYYVNAKQQFWAAANDLIKIHKTGQPVLVVLNSVSDTDLFSRIMIEKNIPHNVLNASNAFWEAQIIAGAGQKGAVTIATTMAGRGTDIKLGKGVKELGGLAVLGIGRMDNVRSERQARGRSGRQGDPGFSQFYVSLEDDIVGAEDDEKIQRYIDEERHISKYKIKRIINQSQKLKVEMDEMGRKKSVQYDEVLQRQRDLIYKTRAQLLEGARVKEKLLLDIARENIVDYLQHQDAMDLAEINRYILDNVSYALDDGLKGVSLSDKKALEVYLMKRVYEGIAKQKASICHPDAYEQFLREAILNAVDEGWVELIDYLEQLKYAVAGRASAQRNIMFEYQNEAFESYLDTVKVVKRNIIRNVLLSDVTVLKDARLKIVYP